MNKSSRLVQRRTVIALLLSVFSTIVLLALLLMRLSTHPPPFIHDTIVYSNRTFPKPAPRLPPITVLTSAYRGQYSSERQIELSLVANRNQRLAAVTTYHRLFENGMSFTPAPGVTGRVMRKGENVTYSTLFQESQNFTGVVVLANADIYFDESLRCAGMIAQSSVLALSRHPSPDCFGRSSRDDRNRGPYDFCHGYHPKHHASHDVFIFKAPVPQTFIDSIGDLIVNQVGAENVIISLFKQAGYQVVNPCTNIHAFHQHCTGERAASAKTGAKSIAVERGQFSGTFRSGFVHGNRWMDPQFVDEFGDVDCLGFGMMGDQEPPKR